MKEILIFIIIIAIPIYGIYGTILGAVENDIGTLISGIVCIALTIIAIFGIVYSVMKQRKNKAPQSKSLKSKKINIWFIISFSCIGLGSILMIIGLILALGLSIANTNIIAIVGVAIVMVSLVFTVIGAITNNKKAQPNSAYPYVSRKKTHINADNIVVDSVLRQEDPSLDIVEVPYTMSDSISSDNLSDDERAAEALRQMKKEAKEFGDEQVRKYQTDYIKLKSEQDRLDRERIEREKQEIERIEQERREKKKKSIAYFDEHKYALSKKYSAIVFNFIEKLTETYPYLFLKMFKDTEIPMSSILVKPYYGTSQLLETKILFDGLKFTEAADSNMNKKIQELTDFFIKGLKKRIKEDNDYTDDFTLSILLYYIIRNNIIKFYRNNYIETYGYENLEEFCEHIANPFQQEHTTIKVLDDMLTISRFMSNNAITEFVYYHIYEKDIELPFVDTYKKIVLDMKQIYEQKQKEKLENELFGKPKKKTIISDTQPHTLSPIDRIDRMSGEEFEVFMEQFFTNKGFKVTRTPLSGDYGVDIIIENDFGKIGVQAKCYSNKVSLDAVQQVVAGLRHYGLSSGLVITNNYFQPSAIRLAADNNITLWNRDKLIEKLKN